MTISVWLTFFSVQTFAAKKDPCATGLLNSDFELSPQFKKMGREAALKVMAENNSSGAGRHFDLFLIKLSGILSVEEMQAAATKGYYAEGVGRRIESPAFSNLIPKASRLADSAGAAPLRWRLDEKGQIQILTNMRLEDWLLDEKGVELHRRQEEINELTQINGKLQYTWGGSYRDNYITARVLGQKDMMDRTLSDLFALRDYTRILDLAVHFQDQDLHLQLLDACLHSWILPGKHQYHTNYMFDAKQAMLHLYGAHRERAQELIVETLKGALTSEAPRDISFYSDIFSLLVAAGEIEKRFARDSHSLGILSRIRDENVASLARELLKNFEKTVLQDSKYGAPEQYFSLKEALGEGKVEDMEETIPPGQLFGARSSDDDLLDRLLRTRADVVNNREEREDTVERRLRTVGYYLADQHGGSNALQQIFAADWLFKETPKVTQGVKGRKKKKS